MRLRTVAAALCAAVLLPGCGGSDQPGSPGGPPGDTADPERTIADGQASVVGAAVFLGDLNVLTMAVRPLGAGIARAASSPTALREEAATFGLLASRIDAVVERMAAYRVDQADVEGQRSRIVTAAPALADSVARAEELARAGDSAGYLALVPQLLVSLQVTFQSLAG